MSRTRAILTALAALALVPASTAVLRAQEPAAAIQRLEQEIDQLSREQRYGEAVSLARRLVASVRAGRGVEQPAYVAAVGQLVRVLYLQGLTSSGAATRGARKRATGRSSGYTARPRAPRT